MTIPYVALWAMLNGPRFTRHVTARDVLAEHLEWVRRTGGKRNAVAEGAAPDADELGTGDEAAADNPAPEPEETLATVLIAAVELHQMWQEAVLGSIPSELLYGVCDIADRGAYLLEDTARDLGSGFRRVRAALMGHSQGGEQLDDEALARVVDDLEALVGAVAGRARRLSEMMAPPNG